MRDHRLISTASPESLGPEIAAFGLTNAGTTWPSANLAIYIPFVLQSPITVVKMFVLNDDAVSGNIDVGIYNTDGTRLVSSGSTTHADTNAMQVFDVTDTTLAAGYYFFACALDNTTGKLSRWPVPSDRERAMGIHVQTSAFALPSTATFAAATGDDAPMIGLSVDTVL